jgi:hypothetical protein
MAIHIYSVRQCIISKIRTIVFILFLTPFYLFGLEGEEILNLVGHRTDRNSAGHGNNVAVYCDSSSTFFYATHRLGNIFNAVDGQVSVWYPDHLQLFRESDRVRQEKTVCVLSNDVVISRIKVINKTDAPVSYPLIIKGDSRQSKDWREDPSGERVTTLYGDTLVLVDKSVFPNAFDKGLTMAIAADQDLLRAHTDTAGYYGLEYDLSLPAREHRVITLACAMNRDQNTALENLRYALRLDDPVSVNREHWVDFFTQDIPVFSCSDSGLTELYAFRWVLLKFSTVGGDLGYLTYPVVLEGRQAYQTYCCFSAPFMAFDLNWASDPMTGFGQIATMINSAYEDGRFPWYTSPRTNRVRLHHESRTGLSLLPLAAWKHYLIHQDQVMAAQLVPGLIENMEWWIRDRDPNRDGLFDIQHQLETGMDDLYRWGRENANQRYDAIDATSYAFANLVATAKLCSVIGESASAKRFQHYAKKTRHALNTVLWDSEQQAFFDRNQNTGDLASDYLAITTFYPFFANAADSLKRSLFESYLLDPDHFDLPHPVPALPASHPDFDPQAFWQGPSWPAATFHVVDAFAKTAKAFQREWLDQAGELFINAANNHLDPRADFYERYNPLTGAGLSSFRDYMHSSWIDLFVRHVAGFTPVSTRTFVVDPLPVGLTWYKMDNIPFGKHTMGIEWRQDKSGACGKLTVTMDHRVLYEDNDFFPGKEPVTLKVRL